MLPCGLLNNNNSHWIKFVPKWYFCNSFQRDTRILHLNCDLAWILSDFSKKIKIELSIYIYIYFTMPLCQRPPGMQYAKNGSKIPDNLESDDITIFLEAKTTNESNSFADPVACGKKPVFSDDSRQVGESRNEEEKTEMNMMSIRKWFKVSSFCCWRLAVIDRRNGDPSLLLDCNAIFTWSNDLQHLQNRWPFVINVWHEAEWDTDGTVFNYS